MSERAIWFTVIIIGIALALAMFGPALFLEPSQIDLVGRIEALRHAAIGR